MQTKFGWYLAHTRPAIDDIWQQATLTVDTNVLLDLYRYHTSTCESMLKALESFDGRVWVPNQVASEFFQNRKRVIASSEKMFAEAGAGLEDIEKSVANGIAKLGSYRLVPRATLEELARASSEAVRASRASLEEARAQHPDYLNEDPVLDRLLKLFDGKVGPAPTSEDRAKLLEEGRRRYDEQIPPGYMDDSKEGDRKFGDFLLWSEVLELGSKSNVPVILVTSERKEDWWERVSGKTLGPRLELLEEFWEAAGQPILIYQTENFLRIANERAGTGISDEAVEEIRSLSARRARGRAANPPAVDVEQIIGIAEVDENHGILEIELLREVHLMTGSGHFEPELDIVPDLAVTVISSPDGCPPLNLTARTGTTFDFNVHVRSGTPGAKLPTGLYRIEYSAVCPDDSDVDVEADGTLSA